MVRRSLRSELDNAIQFWPGAMATDWRLRVFAIEPGIDLILGEQSVKIDGDASEVPDGVISRNPDNPIPTLMASFALTGVMLAFSALGSEVENLVEPCFACHGKNGVSTNQKVPTIAGYSSNYFGFSLGMYSRSERPCVDAEYPEGSKKGVKTNMCEIVKDFGETEIEQVGEFFEKQKFVRSVQPFDPVMAKKGEQIHKEKCEVCHTRDGGFPGDNIGILGGQKMDYLREQIKFVKEGKRFTSKKMRMRLDALGDDDMEAVVHYYGSIR